MAASASGGYPSSPQSVSLTDLSPISLVLDNSNQPLEALNTRTQNSCGISQLCTFSLSQTQERRWFSLFYVLSQSHSSTSLGELPGDMKDYSPCPFLLDSDLLRLGFKVCLCCPSDFEGRGKGETWQGKAKFWLVTLNPLEKMRSLKSCEEVGSRY